MLGKNSNEHFPAPSPVYKKKINNVEFIFFMEDGLMHMITPTYFENSYERRLFRHALFKALRKTEPLSFGIISFHLKHIKGELLIKIKSPGVESEYQPFLSKLEVKVLKRIVVRGKEEKIVAKAARRKKEISERKEGYMNGI